MKLKPISPNYKRSQSTHLKDKILIRQLALAETPGDPVRVLDAFAGNGVMWRGMAKTEESPDF